MFACLHLQPSTSYEFMLTYANYFLSVNKKASYMSSSMFESLPQGECVVMAVHQVCLNPYVSRNIVCVFFFVLMYT